MFCLKVPILAAVFCTIAQNMKSCTEGRQVKASGCAQCGEGFFRPKEQQCTSCRLCTNCEENSGSYVVQACTKDTNAVCACRDKFVPRDTSDSSTCKCNPGFGLKDNECLECEDGYFSTKRDSPCKKWRQCSLAGVKVNGTKTSDVVCKEEVAPRHVATNSTPKEDAPLVLPATPDTSPDEGNQSQKMLTTTTAPPGGNLITQPTNTKPWNRSYFTSVFITFTIVGVLALILLTWKLFSTSQTEGDCELQKHESLCEPVMEIGDKSRGSIKLHPDEL